MDVLRRVSLPTASLLFDCQSAFDFESFFFYLSGRPNPKSFGQVQQTHFAFDEVTHAVIGAFYFALS